jgi:hypothetical protein
MFSTTMFVIIGLIGFALIFVDILQMFSMEMLSSKSGQSTKVTVALVLITISVIGIVYKFIT